MRSVTEILMENLRRQLTEASCETCGCLTRPGVKRCAMHEEKKTPPNVPVTKKGGGTAEHHTHAFVQRCVAKMTATGRKDPHDPSQLSSAFAICTAAKKKNPEAAKEKVKEGVPVKREGQFEKALSAAKKARAEAKAEE